MILKVLPDSNIIKYFPAFFTRYNFAPEVSRSSTGDEYPSPESMLLETNLNVSLFSFIINVSRCDMEGAVFIYCKGR